VTKQSTYWILFFFTLLLCCTQNAYSKESPEKVKKELKTLQTKIQKLEKNIYHTKRQEKALIHVLRTTEKEIGECAEKLRGFQTNLAQREQEIATIKKSQAKHKQQNVFNQHALKKIIRTNLYHQNQEKLKLLLSQNNLSNLSRLGHYYHYFSKAHTKQIATLQRELSQMKELQLSLLKARDQQKILKKNILNQQFSLKKKKVARKTLITQLFQQLEGDQTQLWQLQQQEKHLEKLFQTLQKKLKSTIGFSDPLQRFSKMKKKLVLPIQTQEATLTTHPLPNTKSKHKTYIRAKSGTPVLAIYTGKVVFAEWLRGIGLLIIIDHGNGFMSLYGNNQTLYKTLGERVKPGELIARVGKSGAKAQAGLYFEIRKDGKSIDPTPWFAQS